MKQRIQITVEEERTVVVAGTAHRWPTRWCPACAATVQFAPAEHAARTGDVSIRSLFRWIEAGHVHFLEQDGDLAVCLPSLRDACLQHTVAQ
jgi:hypothetical protein